MKLLIIMQDSTQTCELVMPTRDLSPDELHHVCERLGHGKGRTVHYTDCSDHTMPFTDIKAFLETFCVDGSASGGTVPA